MGAHNSSAETSSVSIDNRTPAGGIDISDEVVQRLKTSIRRAKAAKMQEQEDKPEARGVPVTEPIRVPSPPKQKSAPAPTKAYYTNPSPASQSQISTFSGVPTITAIEIHRQKEIEIEQNDQLWRTRMAQLEQTLNNTNAVMDKAYSAAFEDVRKRFMIALPAHQLSPCQDLKTQLISCYRTYPEETLKCAEDVALFRNCVEVHRIKILHINTDAGVANG